MALSYTIDDARMMCGLGRTTLYKLAQQGQLRLVHVYGRTLVCGDSLRALLGVAEPLEPPPARQPRRMIRRTGRLLTPSTPVSNSTFPGRPPQPS
jgi:hypothetical protein